ncbi:phospho-N-acetylmuramoyl-pentapeptide-transferase [Phytoactinopolyspora halotolerans]|uniref:Phospho-N-acetylmuramoyl-pentapeptide-transferase n=1 Tax=Phytoactinopolyspora halotolerans TaxID=1981512 RepID=A0A6L9SGU1_9ACTN|nr:phospho-N-acetylmuramoyl-pentapeptide-transferase [Phytoactinopolyspora halotolerans]NEE04605.1 phospho-N-acetylmuramoyl-pentapeptide-transferase [Phytoactinopolyspora halotolerans]
MTAVLIAAAVGLVVSILGTRVAIQVLVRRGFGQPIRDELSASHQVKRGTPTMGGLVIVLAAVIGYAAAHLVRWYEPSVSALLVLGLMAGLGLVGFLDDYIKIFKQRSLGLRSRAKMAGQVAVALAFALLAIRFENDESLTPASQAVSFLRDTPIVLPAALFVVWALLIISGTSNAVNLTDGLDGLATGVSVMVFGAYTLIGIWQFNQSCDTVPVPACYDVRDPYDLAVVAAALVGACFGFLWWNAPPAKIIMGDTGALGLGGAMAGLAITTRTELLLVILGGLFAAVTMSVVLQVGYFKLTGGRRLFRMTPLHHHFELKGWSEVTIVVRFWIVAGICVATGLGIFYAQWVVGT